MKTHEVEEKLGISRQSLLYYEREGLINPKRDSNSYRNYSLEDVDTLQLILLLRSMEIPVDDIKQIFNNTLSIRSALETKKKYIKNTKIKMDTIESKIAEYIKRYKVKISFDNQPIDSWANYDTLYLNKEDIVYNDVVIPINEIHSVSISMYSSQGDEGRVYYFLNYYIDLIIDTAKNSYAFQILNNEAVNEMFVYLEKYNLDIHDPLQLKQVYRKYENPVDLNKYLNRHFKEWSKKYDLDNPRDNYLSIVKEAYMDPIDDFKKKEFASKIPDSFKPIEDTPKSKWSFLLQIVCFIVVLLILIQFGLRN